MRASRPPRLADWLLRRSASGPKRQALMGDLHEQFQRGRSVAWYWRQAVRAILASVAAETPQHKLMAIVTVVLGACLPSVYRYLVWPWAARVDRLWYPHLIYSRLSWAVIDPWAYRLQLYSVTYRAAYCVFLALVTAALVRSHPRNRVFITILLAVTQAGLFLPHLWTSWTDWQPTNPIWIFGTLWFSFFSLLAIPASLFLGANLLGRGWRESNYSEGHA